LRQAQTTFRASIQRTRQLDLAFVPKLRLTLRRFIKSRVGLLRDTLILERLSSYGFLSYLDLVALNEDTDITKVLS
jgi:hypothetical protein